MLDGLDGSLSRECTGSLQSLRAQNGSRQLKH